MTVLHSLVGQQGHALTGVQPPQELPDQTIHRMRWGRDRGDGGGSVRLQGKLAGNWSAPDMSRISLVAVMGCNAGIPA